MSAKETSSGISSTGTSATGATGSAATGTCCSAGISTISRSWVTMPGSPNAEPASAPAGCVSGAAATGCGWSGAKFWCCASKACCGLYGACCISKGWGAGSAGAGSWWTASGAACCVACGSWPETETQPWVVASQT